MAKALRTQIIAVVAQVVESLKLPGLEGGVFVRKGKRAVVRETYPCAEVSREPRPDDANRLSFAFDSPGYPVRVVYLQNDPLGSDADTDRVDGWSQAIARAFKEPEVLRSRVPGVWNVTVRPLTEIDPDDSAYSRFAGGVVVTVFTFEPRGVGA